MRLYEIDAAIERLIADSIDEETGELLIDPAELEALQMERDAAAEGLALYVKNATAEAQAIRAEEIKLAERRRAREKAADRARRYLELSLKGDALETARVRVSYRRSTAVELDAYRFLEWAKKDAPGLLTVPEPAPDKKAIADALKAGAAVPFARLEERQNIIIK